MKKQLLSIVLILLVSMTNSEAQIVNAGFENWTSLGTCSDPDGWSTTNAATQALSLCLTEEETSNVYAGSSAITLTTTFIGALGANVPGVASTGIVDLQNESITGGQAFIERPIAFTGWYTNNPASGDVSIINFYLIKEGANPSLDDTVGLATWSSPTPTASYSMFNASVLYLSQDAPTMLQINMFSSNPDVIQAGSVLTVDDLDYETLIVGIQEEETRYIKTYPNPVVEDVFFSLGNLENAVVNVFNVLGEQVLTQNLTASSNSVSMIGFPAGTYIWQLSSTKGEAIKTGKLLLTK